MKDKNAKNRSQCRTTSLVSSSYSVSSVSSCLTFQSRVLPPFPFPPLASVLPNLSSTTGEFSSWPPLRCAWLLTQCRPFKLFVSGDFPSARPLLLTHRPENSGAVSCFSEALTLRRSTPLTPSPDFPQANLLHFWGSMIHLSSHLISLGTFPTVPVQ